MCGIEQHLRPRVLIYRFPNLFGKWCRPTNYNSAVATFCNAFANDLPYTVNDPSVELELLYIDDLVDEMLAGLQGKEHRCEFNGLEVIPAGSAEGANFCDFRDFCVKNNIRETEGRYCYCPVTHHVTLGEIVELLKSFAEQPKTLLIPEIPNGSFAKKLYSTYLSYLPYEKTAVHMLPGYTHNIINLSDTEDLVTVMYCNEIFNPNKPDTFFDPR